MLSPYILQPFLALCLSTTFSIAQPNPFGIEQRNRLLDLPQENIPKEFPDIFLSSLKKPKSLRLKDKFLDPPPEEQISEDVTASSNSKIGPCKPFKTKNGEGSNTLGDLLNLSLQDQISEEVQVSSTSIARPPNPFMKKNREAKTLGELLKLSPQEKSSEDVSGPSMSSVEHSQVLSTSREIDIERPLDSVKDSLHSLNHQEDLPNDLREIHEMFKTLIMNTNNFYRFFSQNCFRKKKHWDKSLGRQEEANMLRFLISEAHLRIHGFERFSISRKFKFMQHKEAIIESLGFTCELLTDKTLVYLDRLRAIGAIQYFKKYLPRKSRSLENAFSQHTVDFQTALELFLTRDLEKAIQAETKGEFHNLPEGISFAVRECFERASFMSHHEQCIKDGLLSDHPQGIHVITLRYLLGSQLPGDVETIKTFTSDLGHLVAENTLTKEETQYAVAIVCHLWNLPAYRKDINAWLRVDQFSTIFFKSRAQQAIESFLAEKGKHIENGKTAYLIVLGLIENKTSPSHDLIQKILDEIKSDSLDMHEKVELFHILNAKSVLESDLRAIVLQMIYNHEHELHVVEVWSHIASQHLVFDTPLDDLDTIAFKLNPLLLTTSYRRLLGEKLQAQGCDDIKSIGQSLAKLPHPKQQEALTELHSLHEHMESVLSTVGDARKHFRCLEVYLHLLWYNPTVTILRILNSMVHMTTFNDNILFFSERALHNIEENSGIAPVQLNTFSEILKNIYWEIVNSTPEDLASETVGSHMRVMWTQQLYSIRPV